jgi:hypothetical protein
LIGLPNFLALELIADQSAGTETERATDGRTCAWMSDRRSDNAADRSTTQGADACPLFARCQATTGTAH